MIKPLQQDDAFLADVAAARAAGPTFHLWWLGQSGYLLLHDFCHVLIDPYLSDSLTRKYENTDNPHVRMSERVVDPARLDFINVVTSSHNHTDHLDAETILPAVRAANDIEIVAPEANRAFVAERLSLDPTRIYGMDDGTTYEYLTLRITGVRSAHEQLSRDERSYYRHLGYVFGMHAWTVYHSGDTVVYDGMADLLRPFNIDVAILPINGKVGNMGGRDAARLAKDIGARVVIPCHYDMFEFNTADPYAEFVPECKRLGQPYRVLRLGERFSSSEIPPP